MTFNFTQDHLQIIADALAKQPYRKVAPVIHEIQRQMAEQQKPSEDNDAK